MILCHRHKFIFFKTRKTAGTSVEIALSRLCDGADIVTCLAPEDEARRCCEGGRQGNNPPRKAEHYSWRDWLNTACLRNVRPAFENHTPAADAMRQLPPELWDSYLKITIERNPWDRIISQYWWEKARRPCISSISEMLKKYRWGRQHRLSNWGIYSVGERIVADHVLSYENLSDDLAALGRRLGVKDLQMPAGRAKGNTRQDKRHYREVLTDEDAEIISKLCAREIAAFGYSY